MTAPAVVTAPSVATSRPAPRRSVASWLLFGAIAVYLLLPMLAVMLYAFATVWQARILPDGYTFDHFATVFTEPRIVAAIARSLVLSFVVTLLDIVIVLPAAYWSRVRNKRIRPLIEVGAAIPFVLPFLVIAFGIDRLVGMVTPSFQNTIWILILGQAAVAFPFLYWSVDGAMSAAGIERLSEAAETCGARPRQIVWRIVIPSIRVGIVTGSILVFATTFGEFSLAQVLVGAGFETLPLWQADALLQTTGRFNDLAATTILSFGLLVVLAAVLVWWGRGQTAQAVPGGGVRVGGR